MLPSLGVTNLVNEVLPPKIINDTKFWNSMVKIKREEQVINLEEYANGICLREKPKRPSFIQQKFDYKYWARLTTNYPKVDMIDEIRVKALCPSSVQMEISNWRCLQT